ncbi:amidohydrolase [Mesorhizobium abyssinicae]|uniref:amidohydrolase n=1 Tax=Mesorhizobium abyssinicae TaxID=1209958 RepID=UPI003396E3D5
MQADMVVTNARILTMDPARPAASAMAIANGRVLAVGDATDVLPLAGNSTRIIDAAGRSVLPGFIEAHMHVFGGGAILNDLLLTGTKGEAAIRDKVRAHAAANPEAKVLFCQGADYDMLDGRPIDRHFLDSILDDRPLAFVAFDHHTMWANTILLKEVGLLHGKALGPGNEVVMGGDALATGELREVEAFGPVNVYAGTFRSSLGLSTGGEPPEPPTPEERALDRASIKAALAWCARHGITSIHNMDGNLYTLELLTEIQEQGALLCRVKVPFHFKNFMTVAMLEKASRMNDDYRGDWLNSGLVKAFYDGVIEGYTAYLVDGYADRPDFTGEPLFTQAQFTEMAIEADRRGLQIAVHAIGDGAVRSVLNGYEAAMKANGPRDARHRVEHIEVIQPSDIPRFAALGAIASMQPPHPPGVMDFPLEPAKTRIGPDRWPLAYAWRTLKQAGAHVVFASDWPVARIDVLAGIHAAVNRKPWAPHLPDQSYTVHEAIAAYTIEGAYAEHAEDRKGQLKPGHFADFVLLSGDIEAVSPEEINTLSPALTVCGGRVTFEA